MMTKIVLISIGILVTGSVMGQLTEPLQGNTSAMIDDSVGKKLAALAIKGSPVKLATKLAEASKWEYKAMRTDYLNNLRASFNLNELNINPSAGSENVFYPRYNFNLVLPVGMFFNNGKTTKKAKANYESNLAQQEMVIEDRRELIELAYQEYQMQRMLLALQETIVQDETSVYAQLEKKFSENSITIDDFALGSKRYNTEVSKRITLIRDRNIAKIRLEKLLGMDLETALKQVDATSQLPVKK